MKNFIICSLLFLSLFQFAERSRLQEDNKFWQKMSDQWMATWQREHRLIDRENSKLVECENSKELIIYSERNAWLQRDHVLEQSKRLTDRFKGTTDILEDVIKCVDSKRAVRECANVDLSDYIADNRKAKF